MEPKDAIVFYDGRIEYWSDRVKAITHYNNLRNEKFPLAEKSAEANKIVKDCVAICNGLILGRKVVYNSEAELKDFLNKKVVRNMIEE